jgi:amino-acid N-acetyltransferase
MLIRKALMRDLPQMLSMINNYASQGVMLPRTEFEMAEGIRDFLVADDGVLVGCGALHIYTPSAAEVRSLAVLPEAKGKGIGSGIVRQLEAEAKEFGLESIFAFTYVPRFFAQLGYDLVDRGLLPQKAWKDCLRCPKFQNCDEIAVRKVIGQGVVTNPLRVLSANAGEPTAPIISRQIS